MTINLLKKFEQQIKDYNSFTKINVHTGLLLINKFQSSIDINIKSDSNPIRLELIKRLNYKLFPKKIKTNDEIQLNLLTKPQILEYFNICVEYYLQKLNEMVEIQKKRNLVGMFISRLEDFFTENGTISHDEIEFYKDEDGFNLSVLTTAEQRLEAMQNDIEKIFNLEEFKFIESIKKNTDLNHFESCFELEVDVNFICKICISTNELSKCKPKREKNGRIIKEAYELVPNPNNNLITLGMITEYKPGLILISDTNPCENYKSKKETKIFTKCSWEQKLVFLYKHKSNCVMYFELYSSVFCNFSMLKLNMKVLNYIINNN